MASKRETVRALLDRHGRTFADALKIPVAKGTLSRRGWRSPRKLGESSWEQRVEALNEAEHDPRRERRLLAVREAARA